MYVAAQVLSEVDAVAIWKKLILQQEKPQVVAQVMEYLTDRAFGRPVQVIAGDPNRPVSIQLNCGSTPEWMQPNVTLNQVHIPTLEETGQIIDGQTRYLK